MKHNIILIAFVAVAVSAAAQEHIRRIGAPQPLQRDSTVSILFNYEESPSSLLDRAGSYQQAAVVVTIAGGAIGAALTYFGASDMDKEPDNTSAKAMYYAGQQAATENQSVAAFLLANQLAKRCFLYRLHSHHITAAARRMTPPPV